MKYQILKLTLKILHHQWYWNYEISEFNLCSGTQHLKKSYMYGTMLCFIGTILFRCNIHYTSQNKDIFIAAYNNIVCTHVL